MKAVVVFVLGKLAVLAGLAAALAIVVFVVVWWFQEWLLYLPVVPGAIHNRDPKDNSYASQRSPEYYSMEHEDLWIPTKDSRVKLHGWLIKGKSAPKSTPTILFFHGNAGNIGHRLQFIQGFVEDFGYNFLIIDYRGYGKSNGRPGEKELVEDAKSVLNFTSTREDIDPTKLFVMGRSLGGAVAVALAHKLREDWPEERAEFPFRGLILENTFLSVPELCEDKVVALTNSKAVGFAFSQLVWMKWRTSHRIRQIPAQLPVLFVSGAMDELVPPHHMTALHNHCSSKHLSFESFIYGDHNFTWTEPRYYERIAVWITNQIQE